MSIRSGLAGNISLSFFLLLSRAPSSLILLCSFLIALRREPPASAHEASRIDDRERERVPGDNPRVERDRGDKRVDERERGDKGGGRERERDRGDRDGHRERDRGERDGRGGDRHRERERDRGESDRRR